MVRGRCRIVHTASPSRPTRDPSRPCVRAASFAGVGLSTSVVVTDRPVTRQGMGGMRVKTAGPGRQVQDVSFFQGELRRRVAALVEELGKMRAEMEGRAKDKATHTVSPEGGGAESDRGDR